MLKYHKNKKIPSLKLQTTIKLFGNWDLESRLFHRYPEVLRPEVEAPSSLHFRIIKYLRICFGAAIKFCERSPALAGRSEQILYGGRERN